MQQLQGSDHGLSRWRCQPVKLHHIVNAHGFQLQQCAGQLAALHLRHTAVWQSQKVLLCAQPEAETRPHSARPPCQAPQSLRSFHFSSSQVSGCDVVGNANKDWQKTLTLCSLALVAAAADAARGEGRGGEGRGGEGRGGEGRGGEGRGGEGRGGEGRGGEGRGGQGRGPLEMNQLHCTTFCTAAAIDHSHTGI